MQRRPGQSVMLLANMRSRTTLGVTAVKDWQQEVTIIGWTDPDVIVGGRFPMMLIRTGKHREIYVFIES